MRKAIHLKVGEAVGDIELVSPVIVLCTISAARVSPAECRLPVCIIRGMVPVPDEDGQRFRMPCQFLLKMVPGGHRADTLADLLQGLLGQTVRWASGLPTAGNHPPAQAAAPRKLFMYHARTDAEITLFSNVVSLTPGSLSLEVSPDRSTLYVHAMFLDDPEVFRRELKQGFERRVLELMR